MDEISLWQNRKMTINSTKDIKHTNEVIYSRYNDFFKLNINNADSHYKSKEKSLTV